MNTYGYVFNNPLIGVDPLGLFVTGEWLERPHVTNISAGVPQFRGYDFGDISLLPPGVRAYYLYVGVSGRIQYKVKCTEHGENGSSCLAGDNNENEWVVSGGQDVNTEVPVPVRISVGPSILRAAQAVQQAIEVATIEFNQLAAIVAGSPTLICILSR